MKLHKTVTTAKVEANRMNSRRSTGPRTGRGKSNAKFNAVTLGLFAKHVVIPICDGYKPEKDFQALLDGLHHEFQPLGFYEEWLVVKIAECMWRLGRAARCESGSVREAAIWDRCRDHNQLTIKFASEICILEEAEEQLRHSGTLSRRIYDQIVPLVEGEERERIQSEKNNEPVRTKIDRELSNTREDLEEDQESPEARW